MSGGSRVGELVNAESGQQVESSALASARWSWPPVEYREASRGFRPLVQRREGCRDDQHVLLLQGNARLSTARRPDAFVAGTFADREALGGILVGPDVTPAVEPAELGVPGAGQGRQLDALGDLGAPAVDHAGDAARLQRVHADLVEATELARLKLR